MITIDYEAIIRSVNQTVVSMFGYVDPHFTAENECSTKLTPLLH